MSSSQLDKIDSQASEHQQEKRWVLKDGTSMTIGNYYRKSESDKSLTLDLVFTFEHDPISKTVGRFLMFIQ